MCLGLPFALLLSPAEKVWRKDGTKVVVRRESSWAAEFKALGKLMISKRIVLLYPVRLPTPTRLRPNLTRLRVVRPAR